MHAYAYRGNKDALVSATSGAAFFAIVRSFFEWKSEYRGIVFAVAWNKDLRAEYQEARSLEECRKYSGSRYIRADQARVFQKVSDALEMQEKVLFVGVPCTIAALKLYLSNKNICTDFLVTVDLICHGAPSNIVWKDHVKMLEKKYGARLLDYSFRFKNSLWSLANPYCSRAVFENGKIRIDTAYTAAYTRLFLQQLIMPRGCINCPFKRAERESDLTIGDFWGVQKVLPQFKNSKNLSMILSSSSIGKEILQLIEQQKGKEELLVPCTNDAFLSEQMNLKEKRALPAHYEEAQNLYASEGYKALAEKFGGLGLKSRMLYPIKRWVRIVRFFLRQLMLRLREN